MAMENISTHARLMIDALLSVHALANMYRSSDNKEYVKTAAGWLPNLEDQFRSLKEEINKTISSPPQP